MLRWRAPERTRAPARPGGGTPLNFAHGKAGLHVRSPKACLERTGCPYPIGGTPCRNLTRPGHFAHATPLGVLTADAPRGAERFPIAQSLGIRPHTAFLTPLARNNSGPQVIWDPTRQRWGAQRGDCAHEAPPQALTFQALATAAVVRRLEVGALFPRVSGPRDHPPKGYSPTGPR